MQKGVIWGKKHGFSRWSSDAGAMDSMIVRRAQVEHGIMKLFLREWSGIKAQEGT